MVTDHQVRRLMALTNTEPTLALAAAKAGMDEKTARKYRRSGKLPNECRAEHTWRTRPDPFDTVWEEIAGRIHVNPGLQAKTLFEDLQRRFPGDFQDGQLRTLQRKIKHWRATHGPDKEIFFPQEHKPGQLGASDFTYMNSLGVTLAGQPFAHMLYHFVLTYSNWETGTICFSESFASLSEGLQNALWRLGGVPKQHRTDCLGAAVKVERPEEFTRLYQGLLAHYGLRGLKGQPGHGNENGDVEQRHRRFKEALDQALLMRGSRDFGSRAHYQTFLSNSMPDVPSVCSKRSLSCANSRHDTWKRHRGSTSASAPTVRSECATTPIPCPPASLAKWWKRAWGSKRSKSGTLNGTWRPCHVCEGKGTTISAIAMSLTGW
jgi:hypothetical protein